MQERPDHGQRRPSCEEWDDAPPQQILDGQSNVKVLPILQIPRAENSGGDDRERECNDAKTKGPVSERPQPGYPLTFAYLFLLR